MKCTVGLLVLIALTGSALGQQTIDRRTITGGDVQHALTDFINSIRTELHSGDAEDSSRRRLQSWSPGQNIHAFFADVLGKNWTSFVPASWTDSSFSWAKLGDFDYSSNLQSFLTEANISSLAKPQSLAELHANLELLTSSFCTPQEFTPGELVYSSCTGPSVTLSYVPKTCIVNESAKQIVCSTPRLDLTKTPGSCTHKYWSAATWTGKECKLSGKVGFTKEAIIGGGSYSLPLAKLLGDDSS